MVDGFADALAETNLLPPLAVRMLRVGDEVGDLASIVRQASHFYEHKLGMGLDRLMGAIGPATIVVVSIVIGTLIVSIMSALLSITELGAMIRVARIDRVLQPKPRTRTIDRRAGFTAHRGRGRDAHHCVGRVACGHDDARHWARPAEGPDARNRRACFGASVSVQF